MSDFEVNLPVAYKSEWDGDATETANDCGPTSAAMVMSFYGENHTTNEIFELTGAGQGLITISQLVSAIGRLGFQCEYKEGLSEEDIKNYLRQGIVPILLVHYGSLNSREDTNFTGGHFYVPVGFRNDGWLVNDPNFWGSFRQDGDHHFYTEEEFMAAWSNCHLDGNPDNAAIIIYSKNPPVNYQDLYNQERVQCDDNWNIATAATTALNIPVPNNPTHDDKVELQNNVRASIEALIKAKNTYSDIVQSFKDAGYNSVDDVTKAIEAAKASQPVVNASNTTVGVPISYPGQETPPVQANSIPLPTPSKFDMDVISAIVWLFLKTKSTLKRWLKKYFK